MFTTWERESELDWIRGLVGNRDAPAPDSERTTANSDIFEHYTISRARYSWLSTARLSTGEREQ